MVGLILFLIFKPRPTCFDGKQNGDETGIDCGGSCAIACSNQVKALKVYWARPLKVEAGWYDMVALVENLNPDLGVREAPYTFSLYDANNVLITKRQGTTFINPGEKLTIFESRVDTGGRDAQTAFIEFPNQLIWEKISPVPKSIYLEKKSFANNPAPVLSYAVTNGGLKTIDGLQVSAVLSDVNDNAFAVSATKINQLAPGEEQDISFTWPSSFLNSPTYIDAYWRLNAFDLAQ